jgi:hypothetical protein
MIATPKRAALPLSPFSAEYRQPRYAIIFIDIDIVEPPDARCRSRHFSELPPWHYARLSDFDAISYAVITPLLH